VSDRITQRTRADYDQMLAQTREFLDGMGDETTGELLLRCCKKVRDLPLDSLNWIVNSLAVIGLAQVWQPLHDQVCDDGDEVGQRVTADDIDVALEQIKEELTNETAEERRRREADTPPGVRKLLDELAQLPDDDSPTTTKE
jgi:hypothetical protein